MKKKLRQNKDAVTIITSVDVIIIIMTILLGKFVIWTAARPF